MWLSRCNKSNAFELVQFMKILIVLSPNIQYFRLSCSYFPDVTAQTLVVILSLGQKSEIICHKKVNLHILVQNSLHKINRAALYP